MPETSDYRTDAEDALLQSRKLRPGREKKSLLEKAEDCQAQAHSNDWRRSHLRAPD